MNLFQWITVPLFAAMAVASAAGTLRRRIPLAFGVLWTALFATAAIAVAVPDETIVVARMLGIGRGADLVFYCAIVGAAIAFFVIFVRLRNLDEQITELVRQHAMANPIDPAGVAEPSEPRRRDTDADVGR